MRTLRLTLAGTVVLAMLGGLGGGLMAHSGDEEVGLQGPVVFGQDPASQRLWVRTL